MRPQTRTLEHVGEWRVTIRADSVEDVFVELARLIARQGGHTRRPYAVWQPIVLDARDCAGLLVEWANELVGRSEVEGRAFDQIRSLEIVGCATNQRPAHLHAEIRGRDLPTWRSPIKAASYHGAAVTLHDSSWEATLLFDV